jgi:CheY-like chemotaxis protein
MENHRKRDVLIVDDDTAIRTLLYRLIGRTGLECDVASDGGDALQQMEATTYAVVLLDLMMPRVDGAEFLKRLEKWQLIAARRPIVLLMTAFANEQLPIDGDSVHAVIRKPFDTSDVVKLVSGCVSQRRVHEASPAPP